MGWEGHVLLLLVFMLDMFGLQFMDGLWADRSMTHLRKDLTGQAGG